MLKEIASRKYGEIREQKKKLPLKEIIALAELAPPPRDLKKALKSSYPGVSVIAEVKKASPSTGQLTFPFALAHSPAEIGRIYEGANAAAVSVLTEKNYFAGSPEDLKAVKEAVSLPVLRKDFILDEYQVYESKAMGADAVLLITSLLAGVELSAFIGLIEELGMSALVETGREEEVSRAVQSGAEIIGINNRDLYTMQVDLERTLKWGPFVPRDRILVSESGIYCREQVELLQEQAGVDAVLVGTGLMKSSDPAEKIRELSNNNVFCTG